VKYAAHDSHFLAHIVQSQLNFLGAESSADLFSQLNERALSEAFIPRSMETSACSVVSDCALSMFKKYISYYDPESDRFLKTLCLCNALYIGKELLCQKHNICHSRLIFCS